MNWADYAIIAMVSLSVVVSLMRGFIKEALSLVTWVIALWAGFTFFESFADFFAPWIGVASARLAVAFMSIFLSLLLAGAIINSLVSKLVKQTGLTGTDRVVGMLFGFARGVIVVGLLVMSAGLTALPQDAWWGESTLMEHFQGLALWMRDFLPQELAQSIKYD